MNKWKISFFTLVALIVLAIVTVVFLVFGGSNDMPKPTAQTHEGNHFTMETTPEAFQNVANNLIREATDGSGLDASLVIDEDVKIKSNVQALGVTIPITLGFEPEVDEAGNLLLYQSSVTVGLLDLPAQTALKLVRDSGQLPEWITIQPSEKTAYIDLSAIEIPISENDTAHIVAKSFDLKNKKITLDVIVPSN